jgi:hypothetical protein
MSYKDKLSKMNARYQESEQQAKAMFGEIDPGVYTAKLANAEVCESKASGRLQVKRMHVVLEGDFKGANVYDYMGLENEFGFAFFREWISKLGYECPTDAADIPDLLTELTDKNPVVQIKVVKNDGGFTNVRVLSVQEGSEAGGEEVSASAEQAGPAGEGEAQVTADPELFILAQAHGAEVTDDMQDEDIIAAMETAGTKLPWKELTAEEQEVVLRHELKRFVQMDKPPQRTAAPAKPAPSSAPARKQNPTPAPAVGKRPLPPPAKKPLPPKKR